MQSKTCIKCEADIPGDAVKCSWCGALQTGAVASAAPASPAAPIDKLTLAKEMGSIEGRLVEMDAEVRKAEQQAASARSGRNLGGIAILLGIAGLFVFWPLLFLGVIGLLAYITQAVKVSEASGRAESLTSQISALRSRQAELRVMLTVA